MKIIKNEKKRIVTILSAAISTGFSLTPIISNATCVASSDWSADNESCTYDLSATNVTGINHILADGVNTTLLIRGGSLNHTIRIIDNSLSQLSQSAVNIKNGASVNLTLEQKSIQLDLSSKHDNAIQITSGGQLKAKNITDNYRSIYQNGIFIDGSGSTLDVESIILGTENGYSLLVDNGGEIKASSSFEITSNNTNNIAIQILNGSTLISGTSNNANYNAPKSKINTTNSIGGIIVSGLRSSAVINNSLEIRSSNSTPGSIGIKIEDQGTFDITDYQLIIENNDNGLYIDNGIYNSIGSTSILNSNSAVTVKNNGKIYAKNISTALAKNGLLITSNSIGSIESFYGNSQRWNLYSQPILAPDSKFIEVADNSLLEINNIQAKLLGDEIYGIYIDNNSKLDTYNNKNSYSNSPGHSIEITGDSSVAIHASGPDSSFKTDGYLLLTLNGDNSTGIRLFDGAKFENIASREGLEIRMNGNASARDPSKDECTDLGAAICMIGDNTSFIAKQGTIQSKGYALQLEKGIDTFVELDSFKLSNTSSILPLITVNKTTGNSSISISNSTLTVTDGAALSIDGNSNIRFNLSDSSIFGNLELYSSSNLEMSSESSKINGDLNINSNSNAIFSLDNSIMQGNIFISNDSDLNINITNKSQLTGYLKNNTLGSMNSPSQMIIDKDSSWNVTASSQLNTLKNSGIIKFDAPQTSSFNESYKSISMNYYDGDSGKIFINTYLENTGSPSDKLVITNNATGTTQLYVAKRGGLGAETTGKGIQVIQALNGATTNLDAFELGMPVSAGAYDYNLYRHTDESWYLTTNIDSSLSPNPQPDYSEEAYTVAVIPSLTQFYGASTLSSWRERNGGFGLKNDNKTRNSLLWVRVNTEHGKHNGGFKFSPTSKDIAYTPHYRYKTSFIQIGADLYKDKDQNNNHTESGLFFTHGDINANISSFIEDNGSLNLIKNTAKIKNNAIGIYFTKIKNNGSYYDFVGQYIKHRTNSKGESDALKNNGASWMLSLEFGKKIELSPKFSLMPQAQIRWQDVNLGDKKSYASGLEVGTYSFTKTNSLQARIGMEINYKSTLLNNAWARFDFISEYKGENHVQYTSKQTSEERPMFISSRKGNSIDLLIGGDINLNNKASIFLSSGYRSGLSERNKGHAWFGTIGMRWDF